MGATEKIGDPNSQGALALDPIALLKALRPLQWVKNGLVFLPFVFAVDLAWSTDDLGPVPELLLKLVFVALAFCALSSAIYLFNDLMDRSGDRLHPVKKNRPIASGKVGVPVAVAVMIMLATAGLVVMVMVEPFLGLAGGLYAGINVGYSLGIKQVVLLDAFAVTSGYIIRAAAGAAPFSKANPALAEAVARRLKTCMLDEERLRSVLGEEDYYSALEQALAGNPYTAAIETVVPLPDAVIHAVRRRQRPVAQMYSLSDPVEEWYPAPVMELLLLTVEDVSALVAGINMGLSREEIPSLLSIQAR